MVIDVPAVLASPLPCRRIQRQRPNSDGYGSSFSDEWGLRFQALHHTFRDSYLYTSFYEEVYPFYHIGPSDVAYRLTKAKL